MSLVADIDKLLPQTQCRACGFNGCRPYAQALASGLTTIDKCPPGGRETLVALAKLLKQDATPYLEAIDASHRPPSVAYIDESQCIGCTKCLKVCPVDAIVGSPKHMHHILAMDCSGCGLCIEPCPVDCIHMQELPEPQYDKDRARLRYQAHVERLDKEAREQAIKRQAKHMIDSPISMKKDYIQEALLRAQHKKNAK
jgi:electron transport complex protein RnfB